MRDFINVIDVPKDQKYCKPLKKCGETVQECFRVDREEDRYMIQDKSSDLNTVI